jgi:hypothetical protein
VCEVVVVGVPVMAQNGEEESAESMGCPLHAEQQIGKRL